MTVPGSNLLKLALSVIGSTPVQYFKYAGTVSGPTGLDTVTYTAPVTVVKGSVQPVQRNRYEEFGLDWSKRYITWFVPNVDASDVARNPDNPGDVIETKGRRYQLMNGNDWYGIDGWLSMIAVDIGPATGALTNA